MGFPVGSEGAMFFGEAETMSEREGLWKRSPERRFFIFVMCWD